MTRPRSSTTVLDEIPIPDYSDFVIEARLFGLISDDWQLPYETSRGCWWGEKHHCTFCGLNGQQMKYRLKSTEIIKQQLHILRDRHGPRQVVFTDNIIAHDSVRTILPEIGRIEGFNYFFETKSNLKKSDLEAFKEYSVSSIQPGIERLNTQVLELMSKGVSARQNLSLLKWGEEFGIEILWNYIYGFPGEDTNALVDEIKLIRKLRSLRPPYSHARVRVDRYSPLFDEGGKHGLVVGEPTGRDRWLPLPLDTRARMAYFFDFTYIGDDELKNNHLWKQLGTEIESWKHQYRPNSLTYRTQGSTVIILDSRSLSDSREIEFSGRLAEIFLVCKEGLSLRKLSSNHEELEVLLEHDLAVVLDDYIITLPTLINR
ncbi:Radical SAM superfamily protein [compost metagenome]